MFNKTYNDVVISFEEVDKRGFCLKANWLINDLTIYMDVIGPPLDDGTTAYFFGNKLIFVTRWSEFTKEDIETVREKDYTLSLTTLQRASHFTLKFGSYNTNYISTAYNVIFPMNDRNFPVEKFIFLFVDKANGEFIYERDIDIPPMEWDLDKINQRTYDYFGSKFPSIQIGLENFFLDGQDKLINSYITKDKDWCDVMYSFTYHAFRDEIRHFKSNGVGAFPNTVYVTIGKNSISQPVKKD